MATEAQALSSSNKKSLRNSRLRAFIILLVSFFVLIAAAATATIYAAGNFWQNALRDEMTRDLTQKAQMFASRVNTDRNTKIADLTAQVGQQAGARATVVDGNGKVIADSQISPASLEKEGEHSEFVAALRGETGIQTRAHGTFGIPMLYVAVPVSGGAVRLAASLADLDIAAAQSRKILLVGCSVAVLTALLISALTAATITPR